MGVAGQTALHQLSGATIQPQLTWREMWEVIQLDPQQASTSSGAGGAGGNPEQEASTSGAPYHHPRSKRVDREALSKSTDISELNRVRDSKNNPSKGH